MTAVTTTRRFGVNAGMALKVPCRVATTANITLSAEQTIDGVAVVENDRVLVKDQTDPIENGIYDVSTGSWRRSPDFDAINDVTEGTLVGINNGNVNGLSDAKTMWRVTTTGTITPGTTAITFILAALGAAGTTTDLVAHDGNFVGSGISTVQERFNDILYITDFAGVDKTGATDSTVGITAARDYIAANPGIGLVWPGGIYSYSVSPNWAIQEASIIAIGAVYLRYTGTGNAVILDGGASPSLGITNMKFGPFIIEAPSTANDGCFIRAIHHSDLWLNVRGCGAASFRMSWCVLDTCHFISSVNEGGWYSASAPPKGLVLESRTTAEQVSYCTFINPTMEGMPIGGEFTGALGNIFQGGAFEGCPTHGLNITSSTENFANRFYGTDFEKNGGFPSYPGPDVICDSRDNEFHGIDTFRDFVFGANAINNKMIGGGHRDITLTAGAASNIITNITIDRFGNTPAGSIIGDTDVNLVRDYVDNAGNMTTEDGRTLNPPSLPAKQTITVSASPFLYQNTSGVSQNVCVSTDQPITLVTYGRPGLGENISTTHGMWVLAPGDEVLVTYPGAAPSMFSWNFAR